MLLQEIGIVKFVQIQRSPLKTGEGTARVYNPAPLLTVARLLLTPDGIIGMTSGGEEIIDVHNVHHSQSRNRVDNPVSIGFTQNYRQIRARYGEHMRDGIGGENIIVDAPGVDLSPDALGTHLAIRTVAGCVIGLTDVHPAPPCVEFSRFTAGHPLDALEVKTTLQFLGAGRRGFYATVAAGDHQCVVQAGDQLCVVR